jgi:hypothetical protein
MSRASKRWDPEPIASERTYMMRGALAGFTIGLGLVIATLGDVGVSVPWFLVAATLVGSVAGLDLYLTRNWRQFGRFTPMLRLTLACTGAAGLTSALGVLLGLLSRRLAWSFTAAAAIGALLYAIYDFVASD